MKKTIIILIVIVALVGVGVWLYNSNKVQNIQQEAKTNTSNYQAEKSSTNTKTNTNINTNTSTINNTSNNTTTNNNSNTKITAKKETEIANFSTKIYSKDEERQKNIAITCRTLSTKEIQPGETFSFCDTVGKATHAKGYEEADIYVNGKKEQGLGGGNCQVSTTLYNAVLKVPELQVVERHEHSGNVPYIQKGKDAAVAYGNYDFKFKNNTDSVIKILMESSAESVTAKLIKVNK